MYLICDAAYQKEGLQVESVLYLLYQSFFSVLKWHLIKIDQGIQILQLKKDWKFLLFLSFS